MSPVLDSDDEPDPVEKPNRVRKYPEGPGEVWVVFIRPKSKPLNAMRISDDLLKNYPGVTNVTKVHRNKIKVTVSNPKEANRIVSDPRFAIEYQVWIPARSVEIDGVVTEEELTTDQIREGNGVFKRRNLPSAKVLEVRQLRIAEGVGESKKFVPSNSYRVTFEGTALPDFLEVGGLLRLPVRMYVPKVMSCTNCQKLGHTKAFCSNQTICAKCGGKHKEDLCQQVPVRCLICEGSPHDTRTCPKYLERTDKLKKELKTRSKRSFAEMVKLNVAPSQNENVYAALSEDERNEEQETTEEEPIFIRKGGAPKRKRKPSGQASKSRGAESNPFSKKTPPEPGTIDYNRVFPPVVKRSVSERSKIEDEQPVGGIKNKRVPFSMIEAMILSFLSDPVRDVVEPLIPFIKGICQQCDPLVKVISFED